jgi:hypothetical protein
MNKLQSDTQVAHKNRIELLPIFNSIFKGTTYWIDKCTSNSKIIPANQIAELNSFFNRFSTSKLQYESVGHSFLLGNSDYPSIFRIVDIRFDNGSGVYFKDVHKYATFESLVAIDPIFIIVLIQDNTMYLAIFDMKNPYMVRKSCWLPGGVGNYNRLQNIRIPYCLKDQRGFPIIDGKCPELINELNKIFK